jgi:hypothetical protein
MMKFGDCLKCWGRDSFDRAPTGSALERLAALNPLAAPHPSHALPVGARLNDM